MSKKVLLILLVFLILFSFNNVLAKDFSIISGYYHLSINPDLNSYIEKYNDYIDKIISSNESWGIIFTTKNIEPLNEIKQASGCFIGISTKLNDLVSIGKKELLLVTQYESFSIKKHGSLYTEWTDLGGDFGTTTAKINSGIEVNGLYGSIFYKINDYFDITGGVGYYLGKLKNNGYVEMTGFPREDLNYDTDLKGTIGYKLGAKFNYKLLNNFSLLCSINYRSLVMAIEDEIKMDVPFEVQISKADLSGLEGQIGLSYLF